LLERELTGYDVTLMSVLASITVGNDGKLDVFKDLFIVVGHEALTPVHVRFPFF
jgi:hypothetical protein